MERFFFFPFDGWLTFDGLRLMGFFDVTSNAWKLLLVEVQDDYGDYSEIRDSSEYSCATSDTLLNGANGAYDFDSGVKDFSVQTTFSMRSALVFVLRTFFFCMLSGTQRTLMGVQPLVPRYWPGYQWFHGIRATLGQHCTAECRVALRAVNLQER